MKRRPVLTLALVLATLALWSIPGASEALQFDRTALAHGEFWRLLTGHLTHWSADHLGWDLAAFSVLGALVELRSRRVLVSTLLTGAFAISAAVWVVLPGLATYRGLSGVDSALYIALLSGMFADAARERRWSGATWTALAAVAFIAKVVVEGATATTVFVAADAAFVPVPLAHMVGGAVGLLVALRYSINANAAHVVAACPCGSPTMRRRSM